MKVVINKISYGFQCIHLPNKFIIIIYVYVKFILLLLVYYAEDDKYANYKKLEKFAEEKDEEEEEVEVSESKVIIKI